MFKQHNSANKFLRTAMGRVLIWLSVTTTIVTGLLFFFRVADPFFDYFWLFASVVSFFISFVFIILRFQTIAERLFDMFCLVLNVLTWVWVVYTYFNFKPGSDAVVLIFVVVQIFTFRRSYALISELFRMNHQ